MLYRQKFPLFATVPIAQQLVPIKQANAQDGSLGSLVFTQIAETLTVPPETLPELRTIVVAVASLKITGGQIGKRGSPPP